MRPLALAAVLCALGASVGAQQPRPAPGTQRPMTVANPFTSSTQFYYTSLKGWVMKAAEQMPEKDYGFRPPAAPAPDKKDIRTFGQIIGHIADSNYLFCGTASGMKGPGVSAEGTKKTKADLQQALADSFAFCDRVWAATTDKNAIAPVSFAPPLDKELPATTRLGALVEGSAHLGEHYGNIVTYMRIKGMVPPSSQGG